MDEESSDSLCDGREDPEDQHWQQEEEEDDLEDSLDDIQDSLEEGDEDFESDEENKPILGKNIQIIFGFSLPSGPLYCHMPGRWCLHQIHPDQYGQQLRTFSL